MSKPRRMAEKSNYLQRNNNYNNIEKGKYGREERMRERIEEEKYTKKKKHRALRIIGIILVILIILILAAGAAGYSFINGKLGKMVQENIDIQAVGIDEEVSQNLTGYRNIALLGIDSRADDYSLGNRSDCIIIFSINENTKKVKMTSIYRDTYVEVPEHGYTKINHAYAYGGATLAMSTINRNLDLNITEYATINFQVVKDLVDEVGGVKISVTSAEATQIPGITKAGTQTLNGEQALAYGRIRKIDTDYQRTERMRTVINAVFNKVKKMSVTEMNKLADKILPEIHTNITKTEITEVITDVASYSIGNSIGWPYQVSGKMISGVWYGVPQTLEESVEKLHKDLFNEENYKATDTVKTISSNIIKKTGVR